MNIPTGMWGEIRKDVEKCWGEVWETVLGCGESSLRVDVGRVVRSVLGCGGGKARSEGIVGKCWREV